MAKSRTNEALLILNDLKFNTKFVFLSCCGTTWLSLSRTGREKKSLLPIIFQERPRRFYFRFIRITVFSINNHSAFCSTCKYHMNELPKRIGYIVESDFKRRLFLAFSCVLVRFDTKCLRFDDHSCLGLP